MIRTTLDCVRPVSLGTWRVERCVCGWSSWLSTSLSTMISGHVLFSTGVLRSDTPVPCWCFLLPESFFSKLLNALLFHFISAVSVSSLREPYSMYWCKFLINALPSLLNACYVTRILSRFKNILHENCLQTPKMYPKLNVI